MRTRSPPVPMIGRSCRRSRSSSPAASAATTSPRPSSSRADEARNYYVQFAVDEDGLFCEVVHNKYLAPEHTFTGDDIAKLLALGFERTRP